MGVLAFGSIIGLEEAVLIGGEFYTTTVVCASTQPYHNADKHHATEPGCKKPKLGEPQKALVYSMKAEAFKAKVASNSASANTTWNQLKDKSVQNV